MWVRLVFSHGDKVDNVPFDAQQQPGCRNQPKVVPRHTKVEAFRASQAEYAALSKPPASSSLTRMSEARRALEPGRSTHSSLTSGSSEKIQHCDRFGNRVPEGSAQVVSQISIDTAVAIRSQMG